MPQFFRTVFQGQDLALFLPDPNWRYAVTVAHRLETRIEEGLTGRENRWPKHSVIRHELSATWTLRKALAAELQEQLWNLAQPVPGKERVYVGMPLVMDQLSSAQWGTRIYDAEWVLNYDEAGYTIYAADALPTLGPWREWFAPLIVGRLDQRPKIAPRNHDDATVAMKLIERSPWDFRIGPAAEAVGADFPAVVDDDWREVPEDSTQDGILYADVGAGRVEAIDGTESTTRRTQKFTGKMAGRAAIRSLLNFFLARKGRVESFEIPWLHRPGADTPETPHATRARFAEDVLTVTYAAASATAKISVVQLPWEVDGVVGETPVQESDVYFYRLWLDVPGGLVEWRFTNYEHNVNCSHGLYLGDEKAQWRHDKVTQTIDLTDAPVSLSSWIFDGNPLLLVLRRQLDVEMNIEIRRGTLAAADTAPIIYLGKIERVKDVGRRLEAPTTILGGLLDMKVPNAEYGPKCHHEFCSLGCTLAPEDWTFEGVIVSQVGAVLTVSVVTNPPAATLGADWFAKGWVKKGTLANYEVRKIVRSANLGGGLQAFTLKRPLRAFTPGETVSFRPYCSGTRIECEEKFDNYINMFAHPHMGAQNLSIPKRESETPVGKK